MCWNPFRPTFLGNRDVKDYTRKVPTSYLADQPSPHSQYRADISVTGGLAGSAIDTKSKEQVLEQIDNRLNVRFYNIMKHYTYN